MLDAGFWRLAIKYQQQLNSNRRLAARVRICKLKPTNNGQRTTATMVVI
jgi:hypothetical protein